MDLTNRFNRQVNKIAVSLIHQFDEQISGIESILKLALGEPDFNTPEHVKKATKETIDTNFSRYTGMSSLLDVREVVAYFMKEKYHLTYQPGTEILVTVEVTEAISASLLAILEQGDKVLLPAPVYPGHEPIITLAGAEPIYLDTQGSDFVLTPEVIETTMARHGEQIKAIILNYPSNPTGVTYGHQELQATADILKKYDTFMISDEIYSELTYDESHVSVAEMLRDQTILINGSSESHVMTGWRIGFISTPAILTAEIIKIHRYLATAATAMSQGAAIRALIEGMRDAGITREEYQKQCDFVYGQVTQLGFEVAYPNGAFYIFAKILTGYEQSSVKFCIDLMQKEAVVLIPSISFGPETEGYVRISYTSDMDGLTTAIERVAYYMATQRVTHWPLQILYTPLPFIYI